MAGVGDPAARAQAFSVLEELFPGVPLHLCTDGHVALVGAFGAGPGIMVQVGTGAIALSSDGRRCGGWGWMVGDEGSAVELGRRALRRALQAMDGRRHATLLGPAIMDRWGLAELKHAVGRVHDAPHPARLLADLFPLLVEVAAQEDAAAIEILWNGGLKLARLAVALLHPALPVAAGGGVFRYSPVTFEAFAQAVEKASGVRPEMARKSPAEGALWLATNR
jgi:N-acetylglucosamine kinase-like BadF-type ATPase